MSDITHDRKPAEEEERKNMSFDAINDAHRDLVEAVETLRKLGADPIPISIVSVDDRDTAQLIVFDGLKYAPKQVAARLRACARFLEQQDGLDK